MNDNKISFKEAIDFAKNDELLFKRRDNGMLLSDYQIMVLKRNGIDYLKYTNARELLFEIEYCLKDTDDMELDLVGEQLAEFIYYSDTKK